MKKHGILWDLDGTILDSLNLYYGLFPDLFSAYGVGKYMPDKEEYRAKYYGRSIDGILQDCLGSEVPPETLSEMSADYVKGAARAFQEARPDELKFVPGVLRVLDAFEKAECPMAIASSSWLPAILTPLERSGALKYFSNIISGYLLPSKPAPDIFKIAAASINEPPENCAVFEDSLAGMEGAKKAGMKCVGIGTTRKTAEMIHADIALSHYDALDYSAFESLFQN